MSEEVRWAFGIVVVVLVAVGGILWKHGERLAKTETEIDTLKEEVSGIRKRLHDSLDWIKRGAWEWMQEKVDSFRKGKD